MYKKNERLPFIRQSLIFSSVNYFVDSTIPYHQAAKIKRAKPPLMVAPPMMLSMMPASLAAVRPGIRFFCTVIANSVFILINEIFAFMMACSTNIVSLCIYAKAVIANTILIFINKASIFFTILTAAVVMPMGRNRKH